MISVTPIKTIIKIKNQGYFSFYIMKLLILMFPNINSVCFYTHTYTHTNKYNFILPVLEEGMRATTTLDLIFISNDELVSEVKVMENVRKVMLPR